MDWIFFYSKKGVQFFFEELKQPLEASVQLATMGKGTAASLLEYGYRADFVGDGAPKSTASAFVKVAAHQVVLFPRAKNSKQSIQKTLGQQIQSIDLIVYENTPDKEIQIPYVDYLVFTSPLNIQTYFERHRYMPSQQIVAIGNSSAESLEALGLNCIIAEEATEESLLAAILFVLR